MTEEAADLSKGHGSLPPGVLPAGKVVDAQLVQVGLVQLSEEMGGRRREKEGRRGGQLQDGWGDRIIIDST